MAFYDLSKEERVRHVNVIHDCVQLDLNMGTCNALIFMADEDTYIRKSTYLALGKIYKSNPVSLSQIISYLLRFKSHDNEKVRQTVVNAAGEIGMFQFEPVTSFFDEALFDKHHIVRNAVIGSIKKMGQKNPKPVLSWANKYLNHDDKEIRREICHGIELRGRTHPQDILAMLQSLEFDEKARVKNTLVHVLGQIAYKKGCLEIVIEHLKQWENIELVLEAIDEIIDVHDRYRDFSIKTQEQAIQYIAANFDRIK